MSNFQAVPEWATSNHSDRVNADDLPFGPVILTISSCEVFQEKGREKLSISTLELDKPYKPCTIMAKVLFQVFGGNLETWIGKRIELFRDARVTAPDASGKGVEKVGGVRVSRVSGIREPFSATAVTGRLKRGTWILKPIPDSESGSQASLVAAKISGAETDSQIQAAVDSGKQLPAETRKRMAGIYNAALARIRAGSMCLMNGETGYGNTSDIWCQTGCERGKVAGCKRCTGAAPETKNADGEQ